MVEPVNDGERPAEVGDDDVDAVLREFGGDPRAAIRALLHDTGSLARDYDSNVSRGYVRRGSGRHRSLRAR